MDASTIISIITTKNELKVHVTPSAKKNEIIRWEESVLYVNINAHPEKGKANLELCKFLKKLTKKQARVKSGQSSRDKTIVFL